MTEQIYLLVIEKHDKTIEKWNAFIFANTKLAAIRSFESMIEDKTALQELVITNIIEIANMYDFNTSYDFICSIDSLVLKEY